MNLDRNAQNFLRVEEGRVALLFSPIVVVFSTENSNLNSEYHKYAIKRSNQDGSLDYDYVKCSHLS